MYVITIVWGRILAKIAVCNQDWNWEQVKYGSYGWIAIPVYYITYVINIKEVPIQCTGLNSVPEDISYSPYEARSCWKLYTWTKYFSL
jgi:hypothetical protein